MPTGRDLEILRTVVDLFVREGTPVSSFAVKETAGLAVSTATIRNTMARLERQGLLKKPYTSGGRIPTDDGYRYYVDKLEKRPAYRDEFATLFRDELRDQDPEVNSILACASRILGNLSKNFAVVYGSLVQATHVSRVRLIELEGTRLLVVVNLLPEYERTFVIRMDKRYSRDVIDRAEKLIDQSVANRTLLEAREQLELSVRDNVTDEGIITREVAIHQENIFSEPPAVELYFEERGHLLEQPELSDPKLLQLLLRLVHNKDYLTSVLSERVGPNVHITIGDEHENEEFKAFSLVTAGYRMGAARGVLGIIGPTRMRYGFILGLVGSAAHELEAIGEEYF
ncbi:MAG: heat-inducible transcription repressor HrcA [Candidatus Latescibacterota bacterium]|nr:MAG: heat-inducible transcription repressor HrcA [Candidatus Latescibacterota bacterium]